MAPDAGFWADRSVLVTGHTGFKGAWLSFLLASLGSEVTGVALPPLPGGAFELAGVGGLVDSHIVDIRDRDGLGNVMQRAQPDVVLHLAAQALVPSSYLDPVGTFDINVTGTARVLDAAGACDSVQQVLVVTSDKVYANAGDGRAFREDDRLGGGDPYSASKAACEVVVDCWRELVAPRGIGVVSARAGNVIGGGDVAAGRLLPDIFRALAAGRCVQLRNPDGVRPWQFVLDPLVGYLRYVELLAAGVSVPPALNFGPNPDEVRSVREVVETVLASVGEGQWEPTSERAGPEASVLVLDPSLAHETIGWRPVLSIEAALEWTTDWFRASRAGGDLAALCAEQIARRPRAGCSMTPPLCRSCGSPLEHTVIDFGLQPLSNAYLTEADISRERAYPLVARFCVQCFLVQVDDVVPPDQIFSDYAYFSSYADTWVDHARRFVDGAVDRFALTSSSLVVEIASNDGYLLQHVVARGIPALGVEPAANVAEVAIAKGVPTEVRFFGLDTANDLVGRRGHADLVVANNVLAHVPDLNDFVAGLAVLVGDRGVMSIEVPHLLELVERVEFDTIYHEHFSYFSLLALELLRPPRAECLRRRAAVHPRRQPPRVRRIEPRRARRE